MMPAMDRDGEQPVTREAEDASASRGDGAIASLTRARTLSHAGPLIPFIAGALTALVLLAVSSCSYFWPSRTPGAGVTVGERTGAALAETADGEPIIRVRLAAKSRTATIDGPAEVLIQPRFAPSRLARYATPVRVEVTPRSWRIEDGDGTVDLIERSPNGPRRDVLRITAPDGVTVLDTSSAAAMSAGFDGGYPIMRVTDGDGDQYALPGEVWLHGRGGLGDRADQPSRRTAAGLANFDIVERLPVELYLPGVIAKELYANWRPATFRAQAIAARSYALHERQRRMARGSHFDLENTTRSQVYAGATDNRTAIDAVRETRGQVLTWQGHLLRAYYSSTTGGRAVGAAEIWPTGDGFEFNLMPPIQAHPRDDSDRISPLFRWTVTRDRASLTRRVRAYGQHHGFSVRQLTELARVEPERVNTFGRPIEYRISDADGRSWTLNAEHLRMACNFRVGDLGPPSRDERVNSSDFEVVVEGDTVRLSGRGFGHGVGMSQFGAEGMARNGRTHLDILGHYYPGSTVEDRY